MKLTLLKWQVVVTVRPPRPEPAPEDHGERLERLHRRQKLQREARERFERWQCDVLLSPYRGR